MTIPAPRKVGRLFGSVMAGGDIFGFLEKVGVERKLQGCLGR
jgi:hypothetical protein